MVQAVLANLKKDQEYWSGEPEIVQEVTDIEKAYKAVMDVIANISGLDQKGYTVAKNNAFDSIMALTLKLCKKMSVYARRNNDNALLQLTDHSLHSLSTGMEKDAMSRCAAIVNKAEAMVSQLVAYKVTDTELAAIRQLMASYNEHLDGRSTTRADKSTSKIDVSGQISALRSRLTLLDELVEGFIDNQEMIARYKASRVILDYGKSKTAKKVAQ